MEGAEEISERKDEILNRIKGIVTGNRSNSDAFTSGRVWEIGGWGVMIRICYISDFVSVVKAFVGVESGKWKEENERKEYMTQNHINLGN